MSKKKSKKKRKAGTDRWAAARARRDADAAYRQALGLTPDEPLPPAIGTANGAGAARGGQGGRRRRAFPRHVS
jgi:hypothetical protein